MSRLLPRPTVLLLTLVCVCVCSSARTLAQSAASTETPSTPPSSEEPKKLEPDQPDVTNGTHIVDAGLLQIEAGTLLNRTGSSRSFGTPVTLRLGVADWLELRLGGDGLLSATTPEGSATGLGNVQLAAKLRLWASPGGIPVLSILPTVNLPAASETKGLGSGQSDYTVALLTGSDLLTHGHVDVNYGFGVIGGGPGAARFAQHLLSISASVEIPGPITPYLEMFWISRQVPDGTGVVAIDGGVIYVITPRFAVDGGIQGGLSRAAPSFSVFGGASVIVGHVLGDHGVHARHRSAAPRGAALRPSG